MITEEIQVDENGNLTEQLRMNWDRGSGNVWGIRGIGIYVSLIRRFDCQTYICHIYGPYNLERTLLIGNFSSIKEAAVEAERGIINYLDDLNAEYDKARRSLYECV